MIARPSGILKSLQNMRQTSGCKRGMNPGIHRLQLGILPFSDQPIDRRRRSHHQGLAQAGSKQGQPRALFHDGAEVIKLVGMVCRVKKYGTPHSK